MKSLTIACGMAPGLTGAGYLTSQLLNEKKRNHDNRLIDSRIIWGRYGYPFRRHIAEKNYFLAFSLLPKWLKATVAFYSGYFERQIINNGEVLLIHPQTLGFKWTINLIRKFPKPVWLFLADSSFFCIRSYNYIPGESKPCLRCLGGCFQNSNTNGCKPFPEDDKYALNFVEELMRFVTDRKIKFIAQNDRQALLAKKHFGNDIIVRVVGLWASDWLPHDKDKKRDAGLPAYDIVFHGRLIAAKGAYWALELAGRLPSYRFLFPFSKQLITEDCPANCFFKDMSWDSGLKQHVMNSRLVLVPSL